MTPHPWATYIRYKYEKLLVSVIKTNIPAEALTLPGVESLRSPAYSNLESHIIVQ